MLNSLHHVKPTVALLVVSFVAADVQAGVGPFLGIYLQAHGWTADRIGAVLTIVGIVGKLVTMPAGALVDATSCRRAVVAGASALSIVSAGIIWMSTVLARDARAGRHGDRRCDDGSRARWAHARDRRPAEFRPAVWP